MTTDDRLCNKSNQFVKRSIRVYLPSIELKNEWNKLAEEKEMSLSKFINHHVTNGIKKEKNEDAGKNTMFIQKNQKLENENKELKKRIKMLENLNERLEEDLRAHTTKPFIKKEFIGKRTFQEDLMLLFQSLNEIEKDDLFNHLDIDMKNLDEIKAVQNQISILEKYNLIQDLGDRWRWTGNQMKN